MIFQYLAVAVIILIAAYGLYRSLRKESKSESCDDCPLNDNCSRQTAKIKKSIDPTCRFKK